MLPLPWALLTFRPKLFLSPRSLSPPKKLPSASPGLPILSSSIALLITSLFRMPTQMPPTMRFVSTFQYDFENFPIFNACTEIIFTAKKIGRQWQAESDDVRNAYRQKAAEIKNAFMRAHPGYKYQPRKSSEVKRRAKKTINEDDEDDEEEENDK